MNALISARLLKRWKLPCSRPLGLLLAGVFLLAGMDAFSQATVTTLANTYNRAGAGLAPAVTKGVATTSAKFNFPAGIALDTSGNNLFLADYNNNAIRWVYNVGNKSSSVTYTIYNNTTGINHPIGVAVDSLTNVYVLNYGKKGTDGSLKVFNGSYLINYQKILPLTTTLTNLTGAAGLAVDSYDNVYITVSSNTVIHVTPLGVKTVVGVITNAKTSLQGIAYLTGGKLAITDAGNHGIWLMDPSNTNLFSNAFPLTGFHGAKDILGTSSIAAFNRPEGIVQSGNGVLVVADYNNNQVKLVDSSGNVSRLFGVESIYWKNVGTLVTKGWNDGTVNPFQPLDTVQSRQPYGLAIDGKGNVFDTEDYYDLLRMATGTGLTPPPPPPGAPTILTVITNLGQVTLTWSTVATATNYYVKRSATSGGPYSVIASLAGTNYTDTTVLDGTNYFYVVSAVNTSGEGLNSAEVSATPMFPPAPTFVTVNANFGQVSLTWSTVLGATSYNLRRSQSTNGPFTKITSTANTSYTDFTVVNGTTYYYVVSAANPGGEGTNSSYVSATPPLPPVSDPQIGYVTFPPPLGTSVFHAGSQAGNTFNNDVSIVIIGDAGSTTFYTYTNTPIVSNVTDPTSASSSAPVGYIDGLSDVNGLTVAQILPDLSIKAIGEQTGHPNSAVVSALFQFVVGNPQIFGNNAAQFSVSNITAGVQLWYTTDGTDPTNGAPSLGPITAGLVPSLNFGGNTNVLFKIRGFKNNYHASSIVSNLFLLANYVPNTINFGFASGPGSSRFVASPGQSFVVPVALNLLSSAPPFYGLQFNLTVTNLGSNAIAPGAVDFESLLGKPDPFNDGYFDSIPPFEFISTSQPNNDNNAFLYQGAWYQGLEFNNTNNENLLGVGWLEVYGRTNLYNTLSQNLLTYPIVDGTDITNSSSQVVIGGYFFGIPTNAGPGDVYQIQIGRPSATTFSRVGYGTPVYPFEAPDDTNRMGSGTLNALKNVTIGQLKYLVGDVYPANWYNAGDFGTMDLVTNANTDVIRVFDFAAYPIASPPAASDLFDALDSCGNFGYTNEFGYYTNTTTYPQQIILLNAVTNYTSVYDTNGVEIITNDPSSIDNYTNVIYMTTYYVTVPYYFTNINLANPPAMSTTNVVSASYTVFIPPAVNTLFDGNDTNTINQIAFGDGVLDVCDVYVTFRRSLDSSLTWYERFWTNGQRVADTDVPNHAAHVAVKAATTPVTKASKVAAPPQVIFTAGSTNVAAGKVVKIPITATISGSFPIRLLMLNLSVVPLDNTPSLATPITFKQSATALGTPELTDSTANGNYSAVWLNDAKKGATGAGVTGTVIVGTLSVTIPATATSGSGYGIMFDHASASPNGLASFPIQTVAGTITVK